MDPYSYFTKDMSFSQSDNSISPSHQALRGKTSIVPTLSSCVPNAHAPKEPNMPPTNDHSFPRYYGNIETPAPQPELVFSHVPMSKVASRGPIQNPTMGNEQEMRTFLTTPVDKLLNMDEYVQVSSMEPPSITSLLQGNKTAILHAHLEITGALDPGPIFLDPAMQIPKVLSLFICQHFFF